MRELPSSAVSYMVLASPRATGFGLGSVALGDARTMHTERELLSNAGSYRNKNVIL